MCPSHLLVLQGPCQSSQADSPVFATAAPQCLCGARNELDEKIRALGATVETSSVRQARRRSVVSRPGDASLVLHSPIGKSAEVWTNQPLWNGIKSVGCWPRSLGTTLALGDTQWSQPGCMESVFGTFFVIPGSAYPCAPGLPAQLIHSSRQPP